MSENSPTKPQITPADTARTGDFIGARDAFVKSPSGFQRAFPAQPGIAVAERQADMQTAIYKTDVDHSKPDAGLKTLADIQLQYIGGLVSPDAMETIHAAAVVENVIRNEVMDSLGLTVESIRKSNERGRAQLLRQIEIETEARIGKIAKLWQDSHKAYGPVTDENANAEVQSMLKNLMEKAEDEPTRGIAANVHVPKKEGDIGPDSVNLQQKDDDQFKVGNADV